jgi:hypothetical protein
MDTALIVITLLSVGLTGALLVYAARLQREQREREEARVSALARDLRIETGPGEPLMLRRVDEHPVREAEAAHFPGSGAEPIVATSTSLFAGADEPSAPSGRLRSAAAGTMVLALGLGGVYLGTARQGAAPRAAAMTAPRPSLELVTLDQARKGGTLTVRGVVRNAGSTARRRVDAVVFAFDRSGSFVSSARAPIDYQVLEGGDESAFTVVIPDAADAARYRVSFRSQHDVLPHLDRRVVQRPH